MTDIEKRIDRILRLAFFPTAFLLTRADVIEDESTGLYFAYTMVGLVALITLVLMYGALVVSAIAFLVQLLSL